ncbi:uncharacterized protein LOC105849631 isoform X1 [Hydra vulgaris]|uniref:uncharacterized protein LOC105849631 isoform X1 n=1 Tax=Hydra vulgaris TaxID=6087 RepID=UPI001F5F20AA|nr:uncharacterized protein LOC105849631 [Hydra vulgaris]
MNLDHCFKLLIALLFISYLAVAMIENTNETAIVTKASLLEKCDRLDCLSPSRLNCKKKKCNQKCSDLSNLCYLVCNKMNLKCDQNCEWNNCKQLCETKECKMICYHTNKCIQIAGAINKYGSHHLRCTTNSLEGCVQECIGKCNVLCNSKGACMQTITAVPYCGGLEYSLAECNSDMSCLQHCNGQLCVFICDSPVCQISTSGLAIVFFFMSPRVKKVTLHCNNQKISWNNWNNTYSYRMCYCMDELSVALINESPPECEESSSYQVPSHIQQLEKNRSDLISEESQNSTQDPLESYSLLLNLEEELNKTISTLNNVTALSNASKLIKYSFWSMFYLKCVLFINLIKFFINLGN